MATVKLKRSELVTAIITGLVLLASLYPVYAGERALPDAAARAHISAGISYAGFGDYGRAMEEFEQALYLAPSPASGVAQMADFYCRTGLIYMLNFNTSAAIAMLTRSYNIMPDEANTQALSFAYSIHAKSLEVRNAPDDAADYRAEARRLNPELNFEKTHRAIFTMTETHTRAAQIGIEISHACNRVAAVQFRNGDFAAARGQYALALVLMPENAKARVGLDQVTSLMAHAE